MSYELEREVNEHFSPFYSYVADEIQAAFGRESGRVLELGPYGPGVAVALAKKCPAMSFTCGDNSEGAIAYFQECVDRENIGERIEVRTLDKYALPFEANAFDLVVFRGGLFFWNDQEKILAEMNRVLAAGGLGALGGGFGAGAPEDLIESLLPQARELNNRLGKMRLSLKQAEEIAAAAGLTKDFQIARSHGLWIFWRKS